MEPSLDSTTKAVSRISAALSLLPAKGRSYFVVAIVCVVACIIGSAIWFVHELSPAGASDAPQTVFEITQGEGFREVATALKKDRLIRSATTFDVFALSDGRAFSIKPGLYRLSASMTSSEILNIVSGGSAGEVTVTIPEGVNIFQVDTILSKALVIRSGDLIRLQASGTDGNLEGKLFPDTYRFYTNSNVSDVAQEFLDNFNTKAEPLLTAGTATNTIILASILEKEVPDQTDQEIVAGIIVKRIAAKMPLDIDATVCYAKLLLENASNTAAGTGSAPVTGCPSLTALDFKVKSPYNSYLYGGLPPGPIGNPGLSAITAALHPQSSPYFYYLSDPGTGKTVFARTLDEQTQNRVKYLESE
jgi:UPF0755 protein